MSISQMSPGAIQTGGVRAVSEWFPMRERALAIGIFNAGTAVGSMLSAPIVTFIALQHGWRAAFFVTGALGFGSGSGIVTLTPEGGNTRLRYVYGADVGGKVAAVGQRMLGSVTRVLIGQFFRALEQRINPNQPRGIKALLSRLFGGGA